MAKGGNGSLRDSARERGSHDTDARTTHKSIIDEPARHHPPRPRAVTCTHAQATAAHHINVINTAAHARASVNTRARVIGRGHKCINHRDTIAHHVNGMRRHTAHSSTYRFTPVIAPSPTRTTQRSSPSHTRAASRRPRSHTDDASVRRRHRHRSCIRRSCLRT
jgi:hypothetical protein